MLKKRLFSGEPPVYCFPAAAKSAAGIGVSYATLATHDAPRVFFCVRASWHLLFAQRVSFLFACRVMVAQAGASHEAPVSNVAGYANPVWAATNEIGVSGGSYNQLTLESATMAATLIPARMQFIFLFAAVRRADTAARPCMLRTTAETESAARRLLARDYVLSFAGRLPLCGVAA